MLWKELTNYRLGDKNSDHLVLKRKSYWKTAIHWCIIFACLCATTAKVGSCSRHRIAHKAYNIFYLDLCKKQNFTESCPKETEVHRAQWWKDNANQSGEKSKGSWGRGEHRRDAERKGGGGGYTEGDMGVTQREVLAYYVTWEGGQASEGSTSHLKLVSETYRPECKSWYASNSSWSLCSALYARMVQSPRRENAKWENTGLCAGEAEIDTWQRKSGRLDARKPLPPGLCGHASCQRESSMWP